MSSNFDIRSFIAPVGHPDHDPKAPIPWLPKAKYTGPVQWPDSSKKPHYSVINESDHFGSKTGDTFDEGAYWYPIQAVTIGHSTAGIHSLQAQYATRSTKHFGAPEGQHKTNKVALDADEKIVGISGTAGDKVSSLKIHTSKRTVDCGGQPSTGKAFEYKVPEGHHVVSFIAHGDDQNIHGIGVKYLRTLPARQEAVTALGNPNITLSSPCSQMFLTPQQKADWKAQGASYREQLREKGTTDLLPIYSNINDNANAFGWYQIEGQNLLISSSNTGMVYGWVQDLTASGDVTAQDDVKSNHIQVGSYTVSGSSLGISNYIWQNIPTQITIGVLTLAFTAFLRSIIKSGIEWAASYATSALVDALVDAGYDEAATLVSGTVIATAGLTVASAILGVGLFFAFTALASVLVKKFYLVVEITNHDTEIWTTSSSFYGDNSSVSGDTWKPQGINAYVPPGPDSSPPPGVYAPVTAIDGVLTYASVVFENNTTFLGDLGVAFSCALPSGTEGFTAKYIVNATADNQIGIQNTIASSLETFFDDQPSWQTSQNGDTTVSVAGASFNIQTYTPALGGQKDDVYRYALDIWRN